MSTKVTLVAHASALIEIDGLGILSDPWYSGEVFDGSWRLLEENLDVDAIAFKTTHIYISHEHPDHFHPPTIRRYFSSRSSDVRFLIRSSLDGRVRRWLEKENFYVDEVGQSPLQISDNVEVEVHGVGLYDSLLVVRGRSDCIVNMNDANPSKYHLLKIARELDYVDLLLGQFGFAEWPGPKNDCDAQRRTGRRYLNSLAEQIEVFKPRLVVPFASFVHFCHPENLWANRNQNSIIDAVQAVEFAGSIPVILVNNQTIDIESSGQDIALSNQVAIAYWSSRVQELSMVTPPETTERADIHEISVLVTEFANKISMENNRLLVKIARVLIGICNPLVIRLDDLGSAYFLDPLVGFIERVDETEPDVTCSTLFLKQVLASEYGPDQALVMMRFDAPSFATAARFHRAFAISTLNRCGIKLRFRSLVSRRIINELVHTLFVYLRWRLGRRREKGCSP